MARLDLSKISKNDISSIMSVLKLIFGKVQERGDLIKNKSIPIMILCGIIGLATIASLIYFILCHYIGPLMIVCAVCVIILAYGLAHSSKNFQNLMEEFEEYDQSIDNLLKALVEASQVSTDYSANALAAALSAELGKSTEELNQMTYADLVACPKYPQARKVIAHLSNLQALVALMDQEKLDVDELLEQYDTTDISSEAEEAAQSVEENIPKNTEESETNTASTTPVINDTTELSDENITPVQHDSNGGTGEYVEDLSIVV